MRGVEAIAKAQSYRDLIDLDWEFVQDFYKKHSDILVDSKFFNVNERGKQLKHWGLSRILGRIFNKKETYE